MLDDIHIVSEHGITYRFSLQGNLLNADVVEIVESRTKKQLKTMSVQENANEVFKPLNSPLNVIPSIPWAKIERLSGEALPKK